MARFWSTATAYGKKDAQTVRATRAHVIQPLFGHQCKKGVREEPIWREGV